MVVKYDYWKVIKDFKVGGGYEVKFMFVTLWIIKDRNIILNILKDSATYKELLLL